MEYEGACCKPSCEGKVCGSDGCGGTCTGSCDPNYVCNPATGSCECSAQSDEAFCQSKGVLCGVANGTDACGKSRSIACDRCAPPAVCDPQKSACICTGESDTELCAALNKQCGTLRAVDRCEDERTIDCGEDCGTGFACDTASNTCVPCQPEDAATFCSRQGRDCDLFSGVDNCGDPRVDVECGSCTGQTHCEDNHCVCSPEEDLALCARLGKHCGTVTAEDNCGATRTANCSACPTGKVCNSSNACVCEPETPAAFCARMGVQCGQASGVDNCEQPRTVAECGPCSSAEACVNHQCVLCAQETDDEFCRRVGAYCDLVSDTDNCNVPRTAPCGSCTAPATCQPNHACGNGTVATNDTCAQPQVINLTDDGTGTLTATFQGDTATGTNGINSNCNGSPTGKDLVYLFTVPPGANRNLQLAVTPGSGSSIAPNPSVRTNCDDQLTEIACAKTSSVAAVGLSKRNLAPGTYYLWVDGYNTSTNGPFELTMSLSAAPPPPGNDNCALPQPLVFAGDTATGSGDNTSAVNDYTGTCGSMTGGDLVYSFVLSDASAVKATVQADPSSPSLQPAVVLRGPNCSSGAGTDQLACAVASSGAATAKVSYLAAGTYYLIADATGDDFGAFSVTVKATPPLAGDSCAMATPLLVDSEGLASITGDTTDATDDTASSCQTSSTGNDLVYEFTVPAGSPMKADIEVIPSSTSLVPLLSLRTACDQQSSEIVCRKATSSTSTRLTVSRLPPGTYYVVVDGNGSTANGAFTLNLALAPPPAPPGNDSCSRAEAITLVAGHAQRTGTTAGALDDSQGGCATASSPHQGGDVVYTVQTDATLNFSARVTASPSTPGFRPAVYIRSDCADTASQKACGNDSSGVATASAPNLPAGTYFVVVDGVAGTDGDFTLEVNAFEPITNDNCGAEKLMTFDANGNFFSGGDMCSATANTTSESGQGCSGLGTGNDVVYKLDTTGLGPKNLTVTYESGHTSYGLIYLRSTCTSSQIACVDTNSHPAQVSVKNLAEGVYYLWLDNYGGSCGVFSLTVHLSTPPPPPANDLCAAAQFIDIDATSGLGSVTGGTTESATGGGDGSCRSGSGGDVVYWFSLPATRTVDIQVTPQPGSGLRPVIYLRTDCATAASEAQCVAAGATAAPAELAFARLGVGTYYLVVDSYDQSSTGNFDVSVTTTAPGAPAANDLCPAAVALPAFASNKTTISGNTVDGSDGDASYCATAASPLTGADLAYSFELSAAARVSVKVTRAAGNTSFRPAVSVRGSCAAEDEVGCALESSGSSTVTANLTAGTWYVIVDGINGSFGPFTLEVEILSATPIAGDGCADALPLIFSGNIATAQGNMSSGGANHDYFGSCATTYTGPELVYYFDLAGDATVKVEMGPQATGGAKLDPTIYLRTRCGDPATDVACKSTLTDGATINFTTARLSAGRYYVFADSFSTNYTGAFVLTVTATPATNPAPSNDACRGALPLTFVGNEAHLTGLDTREAANDYGGTGSCGSTSGMLSGGDIVFSVSVAQGEGLAAAVKRDAASSTYSPALYLRSSCTSAAPADQLACDTTTASYGSAGIVVSNLNAGTYYLVVDGQQTTSGVFDLDVYKLPAAPLNASCTAALPLAFTNVAVGLDEATVAGNTGLGTATTAGIDQNGQSCSSSGSELYYSFTTLGPKNLAVTVTPLDSRYEPAVYLRSNCGDANSQVFCSYSSSTARIQGSKQRLPAGAYTLVVDSYSSSYNGTFSLKVQLAEPPALARYDTCASPQWITLPASGTGPMQIVDDTSAGADNYASVCGGSSYPLNGADLVYGFTTSANTLITAKVTPSAAAATFKPAVYIRSTCETVSDDVCAYNSSAGSSVTAKASLSPGTYYLVVDGVAGTYGAFTLEVSVDDTLYVVGDNCGNAAPLPSFVNDIAEVTGSIANAVNDTTGAGCGPSGSTPDVFYSFTVHQQQSIKVEVISTDTSGGYSPWVAVRKVCGSASAADELTCAYGGSSSSYTATATVNLVNPGTVYFIVIDSYYSGFGTGGYTLRVTQLPPVMPPANDTCAGAIALAADTPVTGTTIAASNDFSTTGGACSGISGSGPDLVYTYQPATDGDFYVSVTPGGSGWDAVLWVGAGTCGEATACLVRSDGSASSTTPEVAKITNATAGTLYFIIVDGYASSSKGDFTIVAFPPPANDTCTGAIALTQGTPVTGSTAVAANDFSFSTGGACSGTSGSGPDLVYTYTPVADGDFTVTLAPSGSGWDAVLWVGTGTCGVASSCLQRADDHASSTTPEVVTVSNATARTVYYIIVDGYSSSAKGGFTITVN